MSISSKSVSIAVSYWLLFKKICEILERGYCESEYDSLVFDLFREIEWIWVGYVPRGQWAPPLREWSRSERREAHETDRQYEEVFAKMNEVWPIIFPHETKEQVADIVQSVCRRLHNGGHLDAAHNDTDARVLAFAREIKARLSDSVPVPV